MYIDEPGTYHSAEPENLAVSEGLGEVIKTIDLESLKLNDPEFFLKAKALVLDVLSNIFDADERPLWDKKAFNDARNRIDIARDFGELQISISQVSALFGAIAFFEGSPIASGVFLALAGVLGIKGIRKVTVEKPTPEEFLNISEKRNQEP